MPIYASSEEVTAALVAHADLAVPSGEALEQLIASAERAVDARLGPLPVDHATGRKLVVELLTIAQRAAVVRAVAVAVGHLVLLDGEEAFGVDDYAPALLRPIRGAGLGVRIDEQLAGLGLIARTGCATPAPEPVVVVVLPQP